MKRSRNVVLVLSGALASGTLAGCSAPSDPEVWQRIDPNGTYTNNYYVSGAGYYHAGYHGWYPYPCNYFDPNRGYYHGGTWSSTPEPETVNASRPTVSAAREATARAGAVRSGLISRGGFGSSARHAGS